MLDIWTYIADPDDIAADRLIDRVTAKLLLLADHSLMGRKRSELAPALRSALVGNYVLLYRPLDDGVELIRVLHGARDLPDKSFD